MTDKPGIYQLPDADGPEVDYRERILEEQLRRLNRYLPAILSVNLLVGGAMIYALWDIVPQRLLVSWAVALGVLLLIRVAPYFYYRNSTDPQVSKSHRGFFVFGSAMSGMLWGVAGVMLFPDNLEYQLFIITMLVGMGAGAVSSLTAYMPAFYAYLPASLLPVTFNLFYIGGSLRVSLGIMLFTYIVALSFFARTINRSLTQTLRLGFQNRALINNLLEAKDRAEDANLIKTKFLAAASHDLRQPLQALSLFVDLLDTRIRFPEVRQIVENIKQSTWSLKELLNALLDISKLDAGMLKPELVDIRLPELLEQLAIELDPQATDKGLRLRIRPCDEWIRSDPIMLTRILRNILTNALRYTHSGGVLLGCRKRRGEVHIEVYDTGLGIVADQIDHIFEEFYQGENPERDRVKGLGLGLAIVKRLADLLQHPLSVRSRPDRGSVFSVTVPLGRASSKKGAGQQQYTIDLANSLVVVIDDEKLIREGLNAVLQGWGCRTVLAESADIALQQLQNTQATPDLIIADYRLREGNTGAEAIRQISANLEQDIPAILITGDTAPERLREAQDSGYHLLHKPVEATYLHNLASYLIEKASTDAAPSLDL